MQSRASLAATDVTEANSAPPPKAAPGHPTRSRLFYFNAGFLTQSRVRRILTLSGYDLKLGRPRADDHIAIWGKSPTSPRGEAVARTMGASLLYVEDAFLRSVQPARVAASPPLGLTLDTRRPYFDSAGPSDLEVLLATAPLDDAAVLDRARTAIAWLKDAHVSKYNAFDLEAAPPDPGYVLVIDQSRDDASVRFGGARSDHFKEMLVAAQLDHPTARIVIKSHPETQSGHRPGHFTAEMMTERMQLIDQPISPYALLEGAIAVYTVSSGMGFEAILAGHKPNVFGQPFYAGWGLTEDQYPVDRRNRKLTRAQLFAGAMIHYPKWYDPFDDRLCALEEVIATLEAQAAAWRQDRNGYVGHGMSLWKRAHLNKVYGPPGIRFVRSAKRAVQSARDRPVLSWASKTPPDLASLTAPPIVWRVEDGVLRSRGLGAELVPPLSLVMDRTGIYYDPTRPSDLEAAIASAASLPPQRLQRAASLRRSIVKQGLSKYNLAGPAIDIPDGKPVVLVPGQVEDDASILLGAPKISTNAALLAQVRQDFPEHLLVYKAHPDVKAGLRPGALGDSSGYDLDASSAALAPLLERVDHVATMTSTLGFEALLRDVAVTCYGTPFYGGWGLTDDRLPPPDRRTARPSLDAFVHAVLIMYPRYFDPVSQQTCPVEIALRRLASGTQYPAGPAIRVLAKLQGSLASFAWIWRW